MKSVYISGKSHPDYIQERDPPWSSAHGLNIALPPRLGNFLKELNNWNSS